MQENCAPEIYISLQLISKKTLERVTVERCKQNLETSISMENFIIKTQMSARGYAKVMLIGLYKKPGFILTTIFGIYYLVGLISGSFTAMGYYNEIYFEIFIGLFILFAPLLITAISVRQFNSNPSFKKEVEYTFGENGIHIQGVTFKAEYSWAHIIKQKEIGDFLILYHSRKNGNFIDKEKLTLDQLEFIKSKVGKKHLG